MTNGYFLPYTLNMKNTIFEKLQKCNIFMELPNYLWNCQIIPHSGHASAGGLHQSPRTLYRQVVFLSTSVDIKYCGWLRSIRTFKIIFNVIQIIYCRVLIAIPLGFWHIEIKILFLVFNSSILIYIFSHEC